MRKGVIIAATLIVALGAVTTASAREETLQGKGAVLHTMQGDIPGSTEVSKAYSNTIRLYKLKPKDVAYWNPHGGKYITAGPYAYLWCSIFKKGKGNPKHDWIAVTAKSLQESLNLNYKLDGVAFYQLTSDGQKLHFTAYPYTTVHGMATGQKVDRIRED